MDIPTWLEAATTDATRRGLPGLTPLLTTLGRATETLRTTRFQEPLRDEHSSNPSTHAPATHD